MPDLFDLSGKKVWVAGHTGLVGSALVRALRHEPIQLQTVSHAELDLRRQQPVEDWMLLNQPDVIIIAAARVGGIAANAEYPADFMFDNLAIAQNIIRQAAVQNVSKLVFLGSSCIYPRDAEQPVVESALLSGPLEKTNEAYALAKIAGLKLCQYYCRQYGHDFISLMPCNLYGPGDRWDDPQAHVIPGLIQRFHLAKIDHQPSVTVWGSGTPLREFLYSDDLAQGILAAIKSYSGELPLNIGSSEEISIASLARKVADAVGYTGLLVFDPEKPDGTPRKVMDSTHIRSIGWAPQTSLDEGLQRAYADFNSSRKMFVSKV